MTNNIFVEIRDAILPNDNVIIRELWTAYRTWGNGKMQELYGKHPHNPTEAVEKDFKRIDNYLPPNGSLLLAFMDEKPCGIGCLKKISAEIGEIKRMYVNPSFRKAGAGRAILEALILSAKKLGYKKVKLESPIFMEAAHALYRSEGFKEISAYDEVEIPQDFREYLLFMELDLTIS